MIALSEVQPSLALFAEAIAGHPVPFEAVERRELCWPWSTARATEAVLLPVELADRESFRSMVLHQLLVEPNWSQGRRGQIFDDVYAIVEDHRVHALTRDRFPGAAGQLDVLLSKAGVATGERSPGTVDEVLASLRSFSLGARPGSSPLAEAAISLLKRVAQPYPDPESRSTSVEVAEQICALLEADTAGKALADLLAELEETDEPALPTEGTTGSLADDGTPSEFVESDGVAGGQLLSDVGDVPMSTGDSEREDQISPGLHLPITPTAGAANEKRTFVYDEWDYHEQLHRRSWCRVIEDRLVGEDHSFIADVRSRHLGLRSQIRRSLMKLRPQDLVRVYRSDDGDELDLDAAIEAMADRRSGAPADERLHIRRDRAARDVATAFLVDLSASTSSPASPPEPEPIPEVDPMDDPLSYGPMWGDPPKTEPVRRVLDVALDAVALMGDALHELGDRHAIYGFSGTGRDNVEFKIGKDFNDRVSPVTWAAVAEMRPLRYTRMGPAVRHAAAKLHAEAARTKLLVVVSDGYPQDVDYGRDRHDRDYGMHDTARALQDATDEGIETFCVTIDPAGHDYLRTMCPDHRYVVIDDVESLPEELAKLYLLQLRG